MRLGRYLRESCRERGVGKTVHLLREAVKAKKPGFNPDRDFSLREMATAFYGDDWAHSGRLQRDSALARQFGFLPELEDDPDNPGERRLSESWVERNSRPLRESVNPSTGLREAGVTDPMVPSPFYAITGAILIDRIREKYKVASFIADQLVTVVPITNGNLSEQIEPALSRILDEPSQLPPGYPYPATRFGPDYITMPPPAKFGELLFITFEMIFSDLTKQAMKAADDMALAIGSSREKRILRVVLGITNNHKWNGTSYNTYQTSSPWINKVTSNTVSDYAGIDTVIQLANNMTDPYTGDPIMMEQTQILAMPSKFFLLNALLNATAIRSGIYPTTGTNTLTDSPNPLSGYFGPVILSRWAYQLLTTATASGGAGLNASQAKEYIYVGDFKRAFVYREVYPQKVVEAPPENWAQFTQDVQIALKCSEYGVPGVSEPRAVFLSTG